MAELTINQLIKVILGTLVVIAVIYGVASFFKDRFLDFFKNLPGGDVNTSLGVIFSLIK